MDVTKLMAVNDRLGNVIHVPYPHPAVIPGREPDTALFFGTGFRNIPDIDRDAFIARTNECLEYVRRQCPECRLQYLVHPAETDEYTLLDLRGFEVIGREKIDDTYFERRRAELKYVFAVHSITVLFAYSLGLNAYLFLDRFKGVYRDSLWQWYRQVCFTELPESAFISNLESSLEENHKVPSDDHELHDAVERILPLGDGTIWFILQVAPLDALLSVVRIVRSLYPKRRIGLLLSRHHRWDVMDLESIRSCFDEVHVFPRLFYSLRLARIWRYIRMALQVRRFPVKPHDVFFGFAGYEFLENCFTSYFPENLHVSFWTYRSFLVHQDTARNPFFRTRSYRFTPASWAYNHIIQPLLGLRRVLFLKPVGADSELYTIHRYQRPMNELYDYVLYLHA